MPRVAVVTGGTRGIGGIVSTQLKAKGYKVAAVYGGNTDAAKKFEDDTGIAVYKFDVSDYSACEEGIALIEQNHGPTEILVNNAGITRDGTMHRMNQDKWQAVIDTNLGSCFNMSRLVIDGMRERKFGRSLTSGRLMVRQDNTGRLTMRQPSPAFMALQKLLHKKALPKALR